jgi:hypothetical protein
VLAVEYVLQRETKADGTTITTETVKVTRQTYTQNWPAYNKAQTQEKSELQALLYSFAKTFLSLNKSAAEADHHSRQLADVIFSSC